MCVALLSAAALSLTLSLALAACSPSKVEFQIDNPTDAPLALSIDGKDLPVAAQGSRPISLAIGEHRLHTDKLGDVPDELKHRAGERAREINAAYERIKSERGLN